MAVNPLWTGAGYENLPTFDASMLGYTPEWFSQSGDSSIRYPGSFGFQDYNAALNKYGPGFARMSATDSNYFTEYDPNNPNTFKLNIKSADKQGTPIEYTRQGDQWVPTQTLDPFYWNTNPTNNNRGMLTVAAAALGGALMGPQAAAGNAVADTSLGVGSTLLGDVMPAGGAGIYGATPGISGAAGAGGLLGAETLANPYALTAEELAAGSPYANFATTPGNAAELAGLTGNSASLFTPGAGVIPGEMSGAMAAPFAGGGITSSGVPDWLKNPKNIDLLAKGVGLIGGGLAGSGAQEGAAAGGPTPSIPQPVPTMYGGAAAPNLPSWGAMGPTETERRMRQQYLPGLLGGANPWGY